ncbi:MAG TPA: erythromycin esterase family protein [Syntrophomonadaceae bacterium]|nr:erythromycin esterase family protein [Syntrophomonadaceae bacterium]
MEIDGVKRYFLIITGIAVCLIFAVFCIYYFNFRPAVCTIHASEAKDIKAFLHSNSSAIDLNDVNNFHSLKLLDSDAEKNSIFLSGEAHAIAQNTVMELYLLQYFNQRQGVRYLLSENGYAQAQLINQYLNTGDESILRKVYDELKGTAAWNQESYDFCVSLRKYNDSLPQEKRVMVVGIDLEHQVNTAFLYLNTLLPSTTPPASITQSIEELRKNYDNPKARKDALVTKLHDDINRHDEDYKKYLGENYFDFTFEVENILNGIQYKSSSQAADFREDCIRNNFVSIFNHLPEGKYYGELGLEHTYLSDHGGNSSLHNCLATFLNKEFAPTSGRVVSIAYFYYNTMQMTWGKTYGQTKYQDYLQDDLLNQICPGELCLMKFTGSNSPFNNKPFLVEDPKGGCTVDYYQYGILIKNSPAAHPYGG